jgi:hypothetical protein
LTWQARVAQVGLIAMWGLLAVPHVAKAQQFECPMGPQAPGDQLVAVLPGSNGLPAYSVCVNTLQDDIPAAQPGANTPSLGPTISAQEAARRVAAQQAALEARIGRAVFESSEGRWSIFRDGDRAGLGCAFGYMSKTSGRDILVLEGPQRAARGISKGRMIFLGQRVPAVTSDRHVRITLRSDDGTAQTTNAILLPSGATVGVLMIPTDMAASLRASTDTKWMSLELDQREIFRTNIVGNTAIINPMLRCMKQPTVARFEPRTTR